MRRMQRRRPRRSARMIALTSGAIVAAILLGGYVMNLWFAPYRLKDQIAHRTLNTGFIDGCLCIVLYSTERPVSQGTASGWRLGKYGDPHPRGPYVWWLAYTRHQGIWIRIYLPYWLFAVPALSASIWGWRGLRRLRLSDTACVKCGYDLAGLAAPLCPECGAVRFAAPVSPLVTPSSL
jgi:hypothetical protein